MPWPSGGDISTVNVDASTDDPNLARSDFLSMIPQHNDMKNNRGTANGVASLDAGIKVPVAELPTNVANGVAGLDAGARVLPANLPRGLANGVASLDASTKILPAELPQATEAAIGAAEIADQTETNAGTDDTKIVTSLKLNNWNGDASLTTLGTIATGTWQGTVINELYGGTGESSYTNGQLLIGNTTGGGLAKANITPGNGIDITNGASSITIDCEVATSGNQGIIELALQAEVNAGDTTRAVTGSTLNGWPGSTNITTLGTIASGTWTGTTIAVANGGTGATTLTNGGVLLGSGTGAITAMAVLGNGSIIVGDGTTDPVALSAFTSSTGFLKHENGGIEANISAITTDNFLVGTSAGVIGVRTAAQSRTHLGLGSLATLSTVNNGNWSGTDLAIANGGTGASAASTAFNNLKQTATESATGVAEIATQAETDAGTDNVRYITPLKLKNSVKLINTQAGTTYTLVAADQNKIVEMNNAAANTLTVPPNSSVAFPVGTQIDVTQLGAGQTTIAQGSGVTVRTSETLKLAARYAVATLYKRATDEWVLFGYLEVA